MDTVTLEPLGINGCGLCGTQKHYVMTLFVTGVIISYYCVVAAVFNFSSLVSNQLLTI